MSLTQSIKGLAGASNPANLGRRVVHPANAFDLAAVDEVELFNVRGGNILLTAIHGEITTVMDATATLIQLLYRSLVPGVSRPMCLIIGAGVTNYAVGCMFTITGAVGVAMAQNNAAIGVAIPMLTNPQILLPGDINLDVTVGAQTGQIEWVIHYIPLEPGATVVTALGAA